jgi:syntaxin 5
MRRRHNSETDNSITQVVIEEEQPELYKDKAPLATNIAKNYFQNFWQVKSESATAPPQISRESSFESFLSEPEIEFVMTARDRTVEFANTIRSLQGRNINRAVNLRDPKKVKQIQNYSEFMMIAKTIGKNIASTYAKLEKLTLRECFVFPPHHHHLIHEKLILFFSVAKRKSLFDDRPAEIHELTYIIKGDLNSLNQQIGRLQEISKSQRKASGKHLLSHSSNMVMALQTRLANMSSNFQQVLEVRTENLKQQKTRREQVKLSWKISR